MPGPQTVWGIEVGKSALKALKMRFGADKSVEVVAADYIEHARIMSAQEREKDALWSAALEKFLSRNDISGDRVVVSVPGQQTLARFSKLPPVDKKKIPDIVRYEADQQIPFDMDEVVWDYQVFQAPDSPDVEVGIFAIKRDLIRNHLLHFDSAGIEPAAVQSSPLALYNAMLYDGIIGDEATVLVDVGTENTDLLVATTDSLWTRTINVGGNNFTEALVKAFKLSFNKAEALKKTAVGSKYARQIFQAMRPVFADLVQELQRSIGFYTATHRDVELSKVLVLGSAFKLPGLKKYVQQNLQIDLHSLEKFQRVTIPETAEGGERSASFAVPYGLAVQGLGEAKVTSNLLPPEVAKQVVWRKKRPFFAAAAACLLLAAGVIWFRGMSDRGTLEQITGNAHPSVTIERAPDVIAQPPNAPPLEYAQTILAAAKAFKSEQSTLSTKGKDEQKKIESIVGLLENRALWLKILDAIHDALPFASDTVRDAPSALAYVQALQSAGVPRSDRGEVFIESIASVYRENVDEQTLVSEWGDILDIIPGEANKARPGFIITMRCRTPHKNTGYFVTDTFVKNLRETGRVKGRGFYFNRVALRSAKQADRSGGGTPPGDSGRGGGRGGRGGRGGGFPPPGGDQAPPPPSAPEKTDLDPLTGEPIEGDWIFELEMDVVLQELPEKKEDKK